MNGGWSNSKWSEINQKMALFQIPRNKSRQKVQKSFQLTEKINVTSIFSLFNYWRPFKVFFIYNQISSVNKAVFSFTRSHLSVFGIVRIIFKFNL